MKKIIVTICVIAVASFAPAAVKQLRRSATFAVTRTENIAAAQIRVTAGELGLNRTALFTVELLNSNNIIIDRSVVQLTKTELITWLRATNPNTRLRRLLIKDLQVTEPSESIDSGDDE